MVKTLKSLLKRGFHKLGVEVLLTKHANFEPQVISNVLRASGADVILDVGANVGQYADMVFAGGFAGRIVSFEALPDCHRSLSAQAEKFGARWLVAPRSAVGAQRGKISFNVAANSVSSSVLPMNRSHLDAAPESHYIDSLSVDMERLDVLAAPFLSDDSKIMIKIDTQGYELEVLKGAHDLLSRTVALQMEISLTTLYEGAPSFMDVISFAQARGFELFSLVPGFWDVRSGRSLQMDGFFIRETSSG